MALRLNPNFSLAQGLYGLALSAGAGKKPNWLQAEHCA